MSNRLKDQSSPYLLQHKENPVDWYPWCDEAFERAERPDIDSVYMSVCHALTGSGGWLMSIFMTADQKPVYAGTYFPPRSRSGMPGFREPLLAIAKEWKQRRTGLLQSAESILNHLNARTVLQGNSKDEIDAGLPAQAAESFARSFDEEYGGI